jgi:hypothetical protein
MEILGCVQDMILRSKICWVVRMMWTLKINDNDRLQMVTYIILQYLNSFKSSMAKEVKKDVRETGFLVMHATIRCRTFCPLACCQKM